MNAHINYQFSVTVKNEDFIVRDHRVHGVRIMPGVTFLDLVYRFLEFKGFSLDTIELQKILFKEAVATDTAYDRLVRISLQKRSDHWIVIAKSNKVKNGVSIDSCWDENFRCEIRNRTESKQEKIDIEQLKLSSTSQVDLDEAYSYVRKVNIRHHTFMKALGVTYIGEEFLLAEIRLSELARTYEKNFFLHPVFLDASTLIPFLLYPVESFQEKPYIPIFIESFRATGKLQEKCYVYIKRPKEEFSVEDILYSDYGIYDESGTCLASFHKLAGKRIRSEELIKKLTESAPQEADRLVELESESASRPAAKQSDQSLQESLRQLIADMAELPVEQIDCDTSFYEMGLHSRHLLQMVSDLESRLETKLYPTLLFEYQTINELVPYLEQEHGGEKLTANDSYNQEERESTSLFIHDEWVESAIDPEINNAPIEKNCLVFDNGNQLLKALKIETALLVKPGKKFQQTNDSLYLVDPSGQESFTQLVASLKERNQLPETIIYRWTKNSASFNAKSLDEGLRNGLYPLLYLTRALMEQNPEHSIQLLFLFATGETRQNPIYPALSGFFKTLVLENPKFKYKMLELRTPTGKMPAMSGVTELINREIQAGDEDRIIRYRDQKRWTRRQTTFLPDSESSGKSPIEPAAIVENGVYLITGGAGGLGLIVAKHIAQQKKVNLILAGRSSLTEEKQKRLTELEALGAKVIYIQTDCSDYDSLRACCQTIKSKFKRIHGVVHSAGVTRDSLILNKADNDVRDVLGPKLFGTLYLDEILRNEKLDFFFLFSSLSAMLGNPGQSDYAFANAFLDHFSHFRNSEVQKKKRAGKTLAFNWPLWKEGGMGVDPHIERSLRDTMGMETLSTEIGMRTFDSGLRLNEDHFAVVVGDREKLEQVLKLKSVEQKAGVIISEEQQPRLAEQIPPETPLTVIDCSEPLTNKEDLIQYWKDYTPKTSWLVGSRDMVREYIRLSTTYEKRLLRLVVETSQQVKTEVVIHGTGEPLVLIPPFGMTAPIWSNQLYSLSDRYQLIIIHKPGHGASKDCGDLSISNLSSIVFEILSELGIESPVHLLGASFGGLIAQAFAESYPEKTASLILSGSFCRLKTSFQSLPQIEAVELFSKLANQDLQEVLGRPEPDDDSRVMEEYEDLIAKSQLVDPVCALGYLTQFEQLSIENLLSGITAPTLIVTGEKDCFKKAVFGVEGEEALHEIPNSVHFNITDAGHFPYLTHSQVFDNKVAEFLKQ